MKQDQGIYAAILTIAAVLIGVLGAINSNPGVFAGITDKLLSVQP